MKKACTWLQVKCCECGYESNTVDDFLHISLEITRAHSLTKALQRFTTGEYLDQENKYKCPKQVTIHAMHTSRRLTASGLSKGFGRLEHTGGVLSAIVTAVSDSLMNRSITTA